MEEDLKPLMNLGAEELSPAREVMTVLTIAATVSTLAQALTQLWVSSRKHPDPPNVTIEVKSGTILNLNKETSPEQIERFLLEAATEEGPGEASETVDSSNSDEPPVASD
jgi:hypothetical protein